MPFNFLPLTYNGELANLPDLESPISQFRDINFINTGIAINLLEFQGDRSFGVAIVAMTSIQTSSEVRSLDVTW